MNEILIYGDIGFEVQAKDVVSQLNEMDGDVSVRVDSYGGDVYAGISILNALRRYPGSVTVYVDGMAASAASFIAVGGADTLIMSPNSSLLIHGAWSQGMGNSEEMAQLSADLNQITDNLATIYAEKTGKESSYWRELMKKDTTFTAAEAVEAGLADMVAELGKTPKAEKRHAVMASQKSRFAANHGGGVPDIESRAAAPPPPNASRSESAADNHIHPKGEERSDDMSLTKEDIVALIRDEVKSIRNESVQIADEVDVNCPSDVKIVPTEKIKVEPVIGDKPAEPVEGEPVEDPVDEPAGDSAEVRSLSEDPEDEPTEAATEAAPEPVEEAAPGEPVNKIVLDTDSYNELKAAAQFGWSAMESQKEKDLEAEVDQWITEGRISSALRTKAVAAIKRDAATARDLYGTNPKNTIPRAEVGYGRQSADDVDPDVAERRAKPNPFPKPKF